MTMPNNPNSGRNLSSSYSSSQTPPDGKMTTDRDKDLLFSDAYLTEAALDDLWHWYRGATKDGLDPQMIFVKMVNAVSSPCLPHLNIG